ncbi:methyltransferase domain-containing protein [Pyramidobacter sp. C12-8]|uniref:methyltransferase domain-containing protein n=1 Tax=Pyramidobacter sp. C12-8 TaxID=1943580 RepID=UPI00098FCD56|nr:methyltransferase domain-containing protein [Pyramidobacter sp. C12-8]OON89723.1 methyltransferase [Pyramidobacter sp. C12-8]
MTLKILDACCGSRMAWHDKNNPLAVFMDNRQADETLCDGRKLVVSPDVVGDFRHMPFPDESFYLVFFDPPHMSQLGADSWTAKKYGVLLPTWREDLRAGFEECFRVLKPCGTLVFKWSDVQIPFDDVLQLALPYKPLFGHRRRRGKHETIWSVFFKGDLND